MKDLSYIDRNVESVRRRIDAACAACGRRSEEITLLAAVKYAEPDEIDRLFHCGVTTVGENRVQQLVEHYESAGLDRFDVHFIGSLQTNKVKYLTSRVTLVESLDSLRLAAELDRQAKKAGIVTDVLCEINSGREENKTGVFPEAAEEFCAQLVEFSSIRLRGFMTMAPNCQNKDDYRKFFGETYRLALDIWRKNLHNIEEGPILSMGMSHSFEQAILEGATVVRVGRLLFEKN